MISPLQRTHVVCSTGREFTLCNCSWMTDQSRVNCLGISRLLSVLRHPLKIFCLNFFSHRLKVIIVIAIYIIISTRNQEVCTRSRQCSTEFETCQPRPYDYGLQTNFQTLNRPTYTPNDRLPKTLTPPALLLDGAIRFFGGPGCT
jgi:hypothetical protein